MNLDGTFNQITGIAWDSDGWQDENGGWWKTVKATGNRMIKRSRAWFSGEVAEADLPMVRYTGHEKHNSRNAVAGSGIAVLGDRKCCTRTHYDWSVSKISPEAESMAYRTKKRKQRKRRKE